jgi:ribose transport system substrate-binding protein
MISLQACSGAGATLRCAVGLAAVSGVLGGIGLTGCGGKSGEENTTAPNPVPSAPAATTGKAPAGGKTVAILSPAKTSEFHVELPKGAAEEAQKLGWPAIIDQAPSKESDYTGQVALAQDILQKHPDAISVCGINPDALNNIVKKANEARIPLFVHNQITPVKEGQVVAYIGYDERAGGRLCGQKAADLLKQKNGDYRGKVAILDGEPGVHTDERAGGFKEALKPYPNIKIVAEQNGKWLREPSIGTTKDWLQRFPDLDLVFGCSDQMAQGASKAAADASHSLFTIGIDGNSTALQDVKDGKLTATLAVQPKRIGEKVVDTMAAYFKDGKAPQVVKTDCVIVTKENVDPFLK